MRTLPLDWDTWDLTLSPARMWEAVSSAEKDKDTGANVGEAKYCAQTVANACRMFRNDAYFFKDEGIPYFENVLGHKPPRALVEEYWREAAMNVPLVRLVSIIDYERSNRRIGGQIRIYTENGSQKDVSF